MAAKDALNKINTVDFFAVVIPGVYFSANIGILVLSFINHSQIQKIPWQIIIETVENLNLNSLLILLLTSILFGSVARAFPVTIMDKVSGKLNMLLCLLTLRLKRKKHYSQEFPYDQMLRFMLKHLEDVYDFKELFLSKLVDVSEKKMMCEFNYWKTVICHESPELFGLIRAVEARVRMFAGIIWSTIWSFMLAGCAFFIPTLHQWRGPFLVSAVVSLFLCLIFIALLRSMRHEEARAVFIGFIVLHRKPPTP